MKNSIYALILINVVCYGSENNPNPNVSHDHIKQRADVTEPEQKPIVHTPSNQVEKYTIGQLISATGFGYSCGLLSKKAARIPRAVTLPTLVFFGVATIAPKFVQSLSAAFTHKALNAAQKTFNDACEKTNKVIASLEEKHKNKPE